MNAITKNKLSGQIMIEFVGLRAKTYSYLIDDDSEEKKGKGTKKCVIKKTNFENDKSFLDAAHFDNKMEKMKLTYS